MTLQADRQGTMPSREFLISQAVLNAVPIYMPATVYIEGVTETLRYTIKRGVIAETFEHQIRAEYRALVSKHSNIVKGVFDQVGSSRL
jgi:hypothetical protein